MPRELPGFYFDEEKKRYFPIKGPIPGSSRKPKPRSAPASSKAAERKRVKTSKLFLERELNGSRILVNKRKCNFAEEFHKLNASQPTIWKYKGTENVGDGALAQLPLVIQTPEGQNEMDALITGGINGVLSFYEVGKARQHNDGVRCVPARVSKNKNIDAECSGVPGDIWRPTRALYQMSSSISCIRSFGYKSGRAMLTTLGAGTDGGCIKILNLVEPLDFTDSPIIAPMISGIASFNCTIWTGDCKPNSGQSVIGTNLGVSLLDLETGASSWVCRGKSDVLALQFNDSENIVLCGLRNGAILTIDVRERTEGVSSRLVRHRLPYSPSNKLGKTKQWFELKGHISPSDTIFMPSSVCSLVSLQSYDQYFLASAMDGSVKLYDHRMAKRGAVQCYEGHVNSHTRLQLGVDWSERFLAAGGEDCNLRMWSIKSGELLFEQQSSTSAPLTTCFSSPVGVAIDELHLSRQDNGLWFGSREGLFYSSW